MKDKKSLGVVRMDLTKGKSRLSHLIAFYNEMTGKFEEDTKPGGVADRPDHCAVIQWDVNNLE